MAHGPGHGGVGLGRSRFECWEKANGVLTIKREFDLDGGLRAEFEYSDAGVMKRETDFFSGGERRSQEVPFGLETWWFANGKKKWEGPLVPGATGMRVREGVWASWYETGARQLECGFVQGTLSGVCTRWREDGKVQGRGGYDGGWLLTGVDVQPRFDELRPIIPKIPHAPFSVAALIKECARQDGNEVQVIGTMQGSELCPPCPPGAMCKPCKGDYLFLGEGQSKVRLAVSMRRAMLPIPAVGASLRVRGDVRALRGCELEGLEVFDAKTGAKLEPTPR